MYPLKPHFYIAKLHTPVLLYKSGVQRGIHFTDFFRDENYNASNSKGIQANCTGIENFTCINRFEPPHGKTNNLHRRKQRRRSATKLISAFVFATRIVRFLFYLNPKFQASSSFLCLYRPVCVGPVRKPHCWFSHEVAHL